MIPDPSWQSTTATGIRSDQVFVEWQTRRGFFYVPREEGETVDGIINQILKDWLATKHPRIVEHLKAQAEAEKNFKADYCGRKNPA